MMPEKEQGYEEIDHTADIAFRIWATTLDELFKLAVDSMNSVTDIVYDENDSGNYEDFSIQDVDLESMLVSLLNDCNYKIQQEMICSRISEIYVENEKIRGKYFHQGIKSFNKEIKAVTYHKLNIQHSRGSYAVEIVFDV